MDPLQTMGIYLMNASGKGTGPRRKADAEGVGGGKKKEGVMGGGTVTIIPLEGILGNGGRGGE